ncbi:MAG: citrate lyase subunit alpha [Synergistaceae bacterium]|jgi:citrate lyase subunit alpha/citrate CoA-transferase|nr:citrate lyase subunit alpha [Synergistaceae bacterium]
MNNNMNKLTGTIEDAIGACGLRDGMAVDFHHHLRAGDMVTSMVVNIIGRMGFKDIKLCSSGIFDSMMDNGLAEQIRRGVITSVETTGTAPKLGKMISEGQLPKVCRLYTHGGRPRSIEEHDVEIDISFIAAPAADPMGNCNGVEGPNACGPLSYSMTSSRHARHTVVITDNLVPYPLRRVSIDETLVDCVVKVDSIGNPAGIATGTAKPTRDPIALILAEYSAAAIVGSGLIEEGFSFQAGSGGPSIAATRFVSEYMRDKKIHGSFILGGITGAGADMLDEGLFDAILDVQCFDRRAIESLRNDPRHREISDSLYANPIAKSCAVDSLDVVVLGGLEVDTQFNTNLTVNSAGYIVAGSGGHSDTAAGAKLALVVAPLMRTRFPSVVDKVVSVTTPGKDIDLLVTQYGVAVNPDNPELRERLRENRVKLVEIEELQRIAIDLSGKPKPLKFGDRVVAQVIHRDGYVIDEIRNIVH